VGVPTDKECEYGSFNVTVTVNGNTSTSSQLFTLSPALVIGYTNKRSYSPGEILTAYLSTDANFPVQSVGIFDLNHHLVFSASVNVTPQLISPNTPSAEGFGFNPSVDIPIPDNIKSGVYLIENQFAFVVKSNSQSDIIVVFPSNTENAYCDSGGKSLYSKTDKPNWVSFLRPVPFPNPVPTLNFTEKGLQWFLNQSDFSISYITDYDLETDSYIKNSKVVVIVGHSEYWTRVARQNFDRFVENKGNALILSGNVMWWQVRYSSDGNKLICYKNQLTDPESDPLLKTINWTDPSLKYPTALSIGADSQHGGYGNRVDNGWDGYKIVTPNSPLLQGTGLKKGDIVSLLTDEYDGAVINGLDSQGYPLLNYGYYNFFKMELIGFDRGVSSSGAETIGTFIAFQRSASSGKIVHVGSTNWCSYNGIGGTDGTIVQMITKNAIGKLSRDENIFSF
jgi:hypothetical protein